MICAMKTTVDIPEQTLREAMRFAKARTKREAVLRALNEFNQRRRMSELVQFSGTCHDLMTLDELMELRERDLPKATRLPSK